MPVDVSVVRFKPTSRTGSGSGPGAQRGILLDSARFPGPELCLGGPTARRRDRHSTRLYHPRTPRLGGPAGVNRLARLWYNPTAELRPT